jgi:hypothetical protein
VVVLAVAACAAAIVAFQDRTAIKALGCGHGIATQPGYAAVVATKPEPPRSAGTDILVDVRHNGQPLSGASVCLTADMVGMPMGGPPNYKARQTAPGTYDVFIAFGMGGTWAGQLVVSSGGRPVLSQPVTFNVGM